LSLFNELKRRNVFKVAIAYIVVAWLVLQVADVVLNNITAPGWVFQVMLLFLILGLPIAVIFAWAFEMTPDGLKRESEVDRSQSITPQTGKKLNQAIFVIMALALGYLAYDKFVLSASREAAMVEAATDEAVVQVESEAGTNIDKSIAVLPFVNLSSDPEQEFFSDGISEELLNVLAQFSGLRVAARTSSFQFKGQNQDIAAIARTLKVAHVLEGSVRKSGNKIRITAQLIKADDGFHMWSKTYDRQLDDIFAIQDEISAAIANALKVHLALEEESAEVVRPVVIEAANTQAYEAYLRGRQLINRRGRESIEDAVRSLERSIRLDSEYAPAHAQLAIATSLLVRSPSSYGELTLEEVIEKATPHIHKALALEPNLAEAHGAQAILALDRFDYMAVLEHTRRALELNPSYIDVMNWQWLAVAALGDYRENRAVIERLLTADPLSIVGRLNYMNTLGVQKKFAEAYAMADDLTEQSPWAGYVAHAQVRQVYEGKVSESLYWFLKAYAIDPGDYFSNAYLIRAFLYTGLFEEARRVNDDLLFVVDVAEGLGDDAIERARRRMELDSESPTAQLDYANTLHRFGFFAEALPLYEVLLNKLPGQPIQDLLDNSPEATIRLALSRRQAGDEDGFNLAAGLVTRDVEARAAAVAEDQFSLRARAMLAALQGDKERAFMSIRKAMDDGMRDPGFFREPALASLVDEPGFKALKAEMDDMLAIERENILQLVCFNNPVPGAWQPLAKTCEGIEKG
jgi:TolB-like protein